VSEASCACTSARDCSFSASARHWAASDQESSERFPAVALFFSNLSECFLGQFTYIVGHIARLPPASRLRYGATSRNLSPASDLIASDRSIRIHTSLVSKQGSSLQETIGERASLGGISCGKIHRSPIAFRVAMAYLATSSGRVSRNKLILQDHHALYLSIWPRSRRFRSSERLNSRLQPFLIVVRKAW